MSGTDPATWDHDGARLFTLLVDLTDAAEAALADTYDGSPAEAFVGWGNPPDDCCFTSETLVMTPDGVKPIGELAKVGSATVLTAAPDVVDSPGQWVNAPIRSFGHQEVWEVDVTRDGHTRTIRTTAKHRWFTESGNGSRRRRRNPEVPTDRLIVGDKLAAVVAETPDIELDPAGIAAGIVFGDGSKGTGSVGASSFVVLHGAKIELLKWMPDGAPVTWPPSANGGARVGRLPRHWKDLPPLDSPDGYLLGWLAGYFATDGNAGKALRLSSANATHLAFAQAVAERFGIATTDPVPQQRVGIDGRTSTVWSLGLRCVPDGFLIRQSHADSPVADRPRRGGRNRWTVAAIRRTGTIEEVFCASVDDTRSFALDGGILTGNCDFVALSVRGGEPHKVGEFPNTYNGADGTAGRCGVTLSTAVRLSVRRKCQPMVRNNPAAPFPTAEAKTRAAARMFSDLRAIECRWKADVVRLVDEYDGDAGLQVSWGRVTVRDQAGDCAGFDLDLRLET